MPSGHSKGFRADFLDALGVRPEGHNEAARVLVLDSSNRLVGHSSLEYLVDRLDSFGRGGYSPPPHIQSVNMPPRQSSPTRGHMSESYAAELDRRGETEASVLVPHISGHHRGVAVGGDDSTGVGVRGMNSSTVPIMVIRKPYQSPPAGSHLEFSLTDEQARDLDARARQHHDVNSLAEQDSEPAFDAPRLVSDGVDLVSRLGQLEDLWGGMQRLQKAVMLQQQLIDVHRIDSYNNWGLAQNPQALTPVQAGRGHEMVSQESRGASHGSREQDVFQGGGKRMVSPKREEDLVEGDSARGRSWMSEFDMAERLDTLEKSIADIQSTASAKRAMDSAFRCWKVLRAKSIMEPDSKASAEVGYFSRSNKTFTSADLEHKMASPCSRASADPSSVRGLDGSIRCDMRDSPKESGGGGRGMQRSPKDVAKENDALRSLLAELSVAYEDAFQKLHSNADNYQQISSPSWSVHGSHGVSQHHHHQHHAQDQPTHDVRGQALREYPPYVRREGSRAAPILRLGTFMSSQASTHTYDSAGVHLQSPTMHTPAVIHGGVGNSPGQTSSMPALSPRPYQPSVSVVGVSASPLEPASYSSPGAFSPRSGFIGVGTPLQQLQCTKPGGEYAAFHSPQVALQAPWSPLSAGAQSPGTSQTPPVAPINVHKVESLALRPRSPSKLVARIAAQFESSSLKNTRESADDGTALA